MINILYVAWNRLEFTRQSFTALLEHTSWEDVDTLYVHDDGSTDGTAEHLQERCETFAGWRLANVVFHGERIGGPVAAMNWYLETAAPGVDMYAKIDNDFVVCPGWLPEMIREMTRNPGLDILGMEPFMGNPAPTPAERTVTEARHIGGKGLIRHRAFRYCRPVPDGYQGFTQWQEKHDFVTKAWITPDLPVFGLDQLPMEPWVSLTTEYVDRGWMRRWPPHEDARYWSWWTPKGLQHPVAR